MSSASTILMIRPVNFAYNEEAAISNSFMDKMARKRHPQPLALKEFDQFSDLLKINGLEVVIIQDTPIPHTPDSIFPNNWIMTDASGSVYVFPMEAENRRLERRADILAELKTRFDVKQIFDLSFFEQEGKFLEGTGSMVLDRDHQIAYACLSPRTNPEVLQYFCKLSGYKPLTFNAVDLNNTPIYHTNVLMCLSKSFAVICLDAIPNARERMAIVSMLEETNKDIVEINYHQLLHFAGNMLQLRNTNNEDLLVLSEQAYKSLSGDQLNRLQRYCRPVFSPLYTIENTGGGSARCMIAEVFLPHKQAMS
ncbi:citrulline utilization hydrolase CtlX [Desertivirga xinjiangensis]|uniref:citrulline utilization hydrolase CtlX n=1 Tax=Desertivirga xinjiangensis TaxID=539206 RepID=UPI00210A47AD|nr:arginine deiminase-related protein [Pedobacter xinjiangensis]